MLCIGEMVDPLILVLRVFEANPANHTTSRCVSHHYLVGKELFAKRAPWGSFCVSERLTGSYIYVCMRYILPTSLERRNAVVEKNQKVPVVMFAGTSLKDEERWGHIPNFRGKAFIKVGGRPMMHWVIDAIQAAGLDLQIIVGEWVIGKEYRQITNGPLYLPGSGSLAGNLWKILNRLNGVKTLLALTCDIPDIGEWALREFLMRAGEVDGLALSIVDARRCRKKYPGSRSTVVWIKGVPYTLGNAMIMDRSVLLANKGLVEQAISLKKSPLKLAGLLGWWFVARLIASYMTFGATLSLPALEQAFSRLLGGISVNAVICDDPGLAYDGDSPKACAILDRALRDRNTKV